MSVTIDAVATGTASVMTTAATRAVIGAEGASGDETSTKPTPASTAECHVITTRTAAPALAPQPAPPTRMVAVETFAVVTRATVQVVLSERPETNHAVVDIGR